MKRHPALVPLSHDHHHTLARARELRRATEQGDDQELADAVARFLRSFESETLRHFREEEELVFPLLVEGGDVPEPVVRALVDHARIHALVGRLRDAPDREAAAELGRLLEAHVRLEERELFQLPQERVPEERLCGLSLEPRERPAAGRGSLWGAASDRSGA